MAAVFKKCIVYSVLLSTKHSEHNEQEFVKIYWIWNETLSMSPFFILQIL